MRTLEIGTQKYTKAEAMDERSQGNANHYYRVITVVPTGEDCCVLSFIEFQKGPIKEVGVNGCQVDTLIHAVYTIISVFQDSHPCVQNEAALEHFNKGLQALDHRKRERESRGVEGTNQV